MLSRKQAIAIGVAIVLGFWIRTSFESTSLGAEPMDAVIASSIDGGEAAAAVERFYRGVIIGEYAAAAAAAIEPGRIGTEFEGRLLSTDEFVEQLEDELGRRGLGSGIASLETFDLGPLGAADLEGILEATPYTMLEQDTPLRQIQVKGTLVGRCALADLDRIVIVARQEDGWKVLLEGSQGPKQPRFEMWFLTRDQSHSGDLPEVVA